MAAPKKVTLEDIDKQLKSMFRSWKRQIKESDFNTDGSFKDQTLAVIGDIYKR